jgi:lipopolysaccharide transport system ATP-binding protein
MTHGRITVRGRIVTLLELGTGFLPELTGRENIALNGALMGLSDAPGVILLGYSPPTSFSIL